MANSFARRLLDLSTRVVAAQNDFVHEKTLSNGIEIASQRRLIDQKIRFSLFINRGHLDEPINKNGAAHFMEHVLLSKESFEEFKERGGFLNASTSADYVEVSGCVDSKEGNLDFIVQKISNILINDINFKEFEREKRRIKNEIGMDLDTAGSVHYLLLRRAFAPHANGILGSRESVSKISAGDLNELKKKWFVGKNISIGITGVSDHDLVFKKLEKALREIPEGDHVAIAQPRLAAGDFKTKSDNVQQLYFGTYFPLEPTNMKQDAILTFANRYLSEEVDMRLSKNLGAVYAVWSTISNGLHRNGYVGIEGSCLPEDGHLIIPEISASLVSASQKINPAVFKRLKNDLLEGSRFSKHLFFSVHSAFGLAQEKRVTGRINTIYEMENIMKEVTADDVRECIQQLASKPPTIVSYGDGSTLGNAAQLRSFLDEGISRQAQPEKIAFEAS